MAAVYGLGLALASPAGAAVPLGGEFQVNTGTMNNQRTPDVAFLPDGRFIVVWGHGIGASSGTDTSSPSIAGQFYAADGSPQGGEFQVNTYTTGSQTAPSVAVRPNGDFVVVWESNGSAGTDVGTTLSIQGQRYAANGTPLGSQFQVNTYTTLQQRDAAVGVDSDGDFVVVWDSGGSSGPDSSGTSIQGQRYAANGSTLGGEFQVNTYTTDFQVGPSIAMAPDGSFVVVWNSDGSFGSDPADSIQGQRYASNGVPQGTEFQVNTITEGSQSSPTIASTSTGDFVIAWRDLSLSMGADIKAQRYAADGSTQGGEFSVESQAGNPGGADISATPDGRFVVVWNAYATSGSDTSNLAVQGRALTAAGAPLGPTFQVNTYTTGAQSMPAVAADDEGFVVVWSSQGSAGTDTSSGSIQGQRYSDDVPLDVPALSSAQAVLCALGLLATSAAWLRARRN